MKKRLSQIALMCLMAPVASIAFASQAAAQMQGDFDAADSNHDGKVSLAEFETYATQRLMAGSGMRAQRFKMLSADEQKERLKQRFEAVDADRNGYLDRKEWTGS